MASVRKRVWTYKGVEKAAWVVSYKDNRGKSRLKTFAMKKDADRARGKIEQELQAGAHVPDRESATVKQVCDHYQGEIDQKVSDGRIGKGRRYSLQMMIKNHIIPVLGSRRLNALRIEDVEELRDELVKNGAAITHIKGILNTLKLIERYGRKRGVTTRTVVADAMSEMRGMRNAVVETFTEEQVRRILIAAGQPTMRPRKVIVRRYVSRPQTIALRQCFVNIGAFCGLRIGEIAALSLAAVDLQNRVLHVRRNITIFEEDKGPKTRAGVRDIPLPKHVAELIADWIRLYYRPNKEDVLFHTIDGERRIKHSNFYNNSWLTILLGAGIIKRIGEPDTPHFNALRHFTASLMVADGLPLTDVASLMGHESFDTTLQVYAHPIVRGQRRNEVFETMASRLIGAE